MQVKYYTISPGCTDGDGNKLFLTTGPLGSVMVDKQSTAHPDSQLWALIPPSKPYGLLIVSKSLSTGSTMMAIDAPNPNATVRLVSSQTLVHGAWNVVDSGAIQLHANPSMNLNVDGSQAFGSTSKVLAWTWGGGSPNEVWTFTPEGQVTSLIAAVAQA